ncbi:MAG: hypothetical protein RXR04_07205 [Caldivirga sp.]
MECVLIGWSGGCASPVEMLGIVVIRRQSSSMHNGGIGYTAT